MKNHTLTILLLILSIVLLSTGCSNILEEEGQIQLTLALDDHGFSTSTNFSLSMRQEGSKTTIQKDLGPDIRPEPIKLSAGTWDLSVQALDAHGVQQGQGFATCTVLPGKKASVTIGISYDYLVNFDLNYPSSPPNPESIGVVYDSPYGMLPTPTERIGYTFAGWYDADSQAITADTKYRKKSGQTLYAHWTAKTYQVSFDPNGGNEPESIIVTHGSTYGELPLSTRDNYSFGGWHIEESNNNGVGTKVWSTTDVTITSDQILYAHWTGESHQVSFDSNGGTGQESILVTYGSNYGTLPQPTRTGYTFINWCTSESDDNGYGSVISDTSEVYLTADQTLHARWEARSYTVGFDANAGQPQSISGKTIVFGQTYESLPIPSRSGYIFSGWYTQEVDDNGSGTKVEPTTPAFIASDHTLYARWKLSSYLVSFDSNGGGSIDSITVMFGSPYGTLAEPTKDGYTFEGWYTAEINNNGSGSKVENTTPVSSFAPHMLYAQWTASTYQIGFDANGGTTESSLNVTFGSPYGTLPNPSREGYTFNGWYTSETDGNGSGTRITAASTVCTISNQMLYAQWTMLETTRVALDMANLQITYAPGDSSTSVTTTIGLNTIGTNGSTISWSSDDSAINCPFGIVRRPTYLTGDKTVTLTAIIRYGLAIERKTFTLTVNKLAATDKELAQIDASTAPNYIVFTGNDTITSVTGDLLLPSVGANGSNIEWSKGNDVFSSVTLSGTTAFISRPSVGSSNGYAFFTLKVTKGNETAYSSFAITILAWTEAEQGAHAMASE